MTQKFIYLCRFNESAFSPETYEKVDILESAIDILESGSGDASVIFTASSYTSSIIFEMLDNVKAALLQLAQKVLAAITNFYLNSRKLIEKFRERVLDSLPRNYTIRHETFEYPYLRDYPVELKATISQRDRIEKLQQKIKTEPILPIDVASEVDVLILSFAKDVIGDYPDLFNLSASVSKIVQEKVRGKKIIEVVDRTTLDQHITSISNYKRDKEDIQRTKRAVISDYESLKRTYSSVTKDADALSRNSIKDVQSPDKSRLLASEYSRFADIHVEMTRLFNSYIKIYDVAFTTKLNELQNKINDYQNLVTEVITRSNLFASVNTKSTEELTKAIPYQPELRM